MITNKFNPTEKDIQRFWSYVDKRPDGCWGWLGHMNKNNPIPKGDFYYGRSVTTAARFSYLLHGGSVAARSFVRAKCAMPSCVNPDHLEMPGNRIRPLSFYVDRFLSKVSKTESGCWEWMGHIGSNGYGAFWVNNSPITAHRYSYLAFRGDIPEGMMVCHKCDNRKCANPDHLFIGDAFDNMGDCKAKGRIVTLSGEDAPWAKLSEEDVVAIKEMLAERRLMQKEIAKEFGVSHTTIGSIAQGRNWKHVTAHTSGSRN